LILRNIDKIVATRYHILQLKCTEFDFGWGSARPPSWFLGALLLRGGEGPGEEGREGVGRGRGMGQGRERTPAFGLHPLKMNRR